MHRDLDVTTPYVTLCATCGFLAPRPGDAQPERTLAASELPACPVETTAALVGNKWRLVILRDLLEGTRRFGELKRSVTGISQKVLTSNLREMEERGLVVRRVYPEVPPRVEYALTETGESLRPVIDAMWAWGESYQARAR